MQTVERVRPLYNKANVFVKADQLVEKIAPRGDRRRRQAARVPRIAHYLVDTVLERQPCTRKVRKPSWWSWDAERTARLTRSELD